MKKYFCTLLLIAFVTPSVAFASWWNPFSWGIFHRIEIETKTETTENQLQKNYNPAPDSYGVVKPVTPVSVLSVKVPVTKETSVVASDIDYLLVQKTQAQVKIEEASKDKLEQESLLAKQDEQGKYLYQYQRVQKKINDLQKQHDILKKRMLSQSCTSFQQGSAMAECLLASQKASDITEYQSAILNNFITPVTDFSIEYEDELDTLSKQIFQIKTSYHEGVADIKSQAIPLNFQQGKIEQLTNETDLKIKAINSQIQFVWSDYYAGITPDF